MSSKKMILVTVGSAPHPFTRLVEAAEHLASDSGYEVIIQYGFTPVSLKAAKGFDFVPYEEMVALYQRADLVISHASAGPILFAEQFQKPLVLFPRSGDMKEHVDNHQMDFAHALQRHGAGFDIVFSGEDVAGAVERSFHRSPVKVPHQRKKVSNKIADYLKMLEKEKSRSIKNSGWRKLKELLYFLRIYRFIASLRNHTFWMLRGGYKPKDFWNRWSRHYIREKSRGAIGQSHAWLKGQLQKCPGGKILEAGCGYGRTLQFLKENDKDGKYFFTGADISIEMLNYGQSQSPELAGRIFCADMGALPFTDRSFEMVYTRGALMHCPPQRLESVLKELERVSKGNLILVEETFWDTNSHKGQTFSLNDYTFIHDYQTVLGRLGWQVSETKIVDEGMIVLICLSCRKAKPGREFEAAAAAEGEQGQFR